MAHREPFDMGLVQHRLVPGDAQEVIVTPLEPRIGDHGTGHERSAVVVVAGTVVAAQGVAVHGRVPAHLPVHSLGVGVQQQLGGIAPQPGLGVVGTVDPVAVALARFDPGEKAVPHVAVDLGEVEATLLSARVVEQAQLDPLRNLREQREIGPHALVGCPQRVGVSGPDLHGVTVRGPASHHHRPASLRPRDHRSATAGAIPLARFPEDRRPRLPGRQPGSLVIVQVEGPQRVVSEVVHAAGDRHAVSVASTVPAPSCCLPSPGPCSSISGWSRLAKIRAP